MQPVHVPLKAIITRGYLTDHIGIVVGYDSEENIVSLELDADTIVSVPRDAIDQQPFLQNKRKDTHHGN